MVVPVSWYQNVSPNWNTLFLMMMDRASMKTAAGIELNCLLRWWMCWAISMSAIYVSMLVYMELASAVNSLAPGGSGDNGTISPFRAFEIFRYVF